MAGIRLSARSWPADLTVEALVADATKVYHHLFSASTVAIAERRLADHGYPASDGQPNPS
jgi:hypothetical protein